MKVQFKVDPTAAGVETWEYVDRHCHACGRTPVWMRTDGHDAAGQPHLCLACGAAACLAPVRTSDAQTAQRLSAIAASIGARSPLDGAITASPMPPGAEQSARPPRGVNWIVQKLR